MVHPKKPDQSWEKWLAHGWHLQVLAQGRRNTGKVEITEDIKSSSCRLHGLCFCYETAVAPGSTGPGTSRRSFEVKTAWT